jgi:hypothetical protein
VRRRREDAARSEGPSVAAYFAEATKAKKAMEGKLKVGRKTQDYETQDTRRRGRGDEFASVQCSVFRKKEKEMKH